MKPLYFCYRFNTKAKALKGLPAHFIYHKVVVNKHSLRKIRVILEGNMMYEPLIQKQFMPL